MNKKLIKAVLGSVAAVTLVLLFADPAPAQTTDSSTTGSSQTTNSTPSDSLMSGSLSSNAPGTWVTQGIANQYDHSNITPGTASTTSENSFLSFLEQLISLFTTILQGLFSALSSIFGATAGS